MKKITVFLLAIIFSLQAFSQSAVQAQLKKYVSVLASDSLMGRKAGTVYETKSADFINKVFEENGVSLLYPREGQDFSFVLKPGDTIASRNIIGIVQGYDPALKNEYIVVGAHYDHLGYNKLKVNGKDSLQIYRGADDNASGVACLLELAKRAAAENFMFKRSVIFAAFGSEEAGMTGSWYFVNRAFGHISKVDYMIDLDMVGRSGGENYLRAYTMVPDVELNDFFTALKNSTYPVKPAVFGTDYFASDHNPFAAAGIPVTLFTTGLHRDYHTINDTPDKLDYSQMQDICDYVFDLMKSVSDREKPLSRNILSNDTTAKGEKVYSLLEVDKRPVYIHGDEGTFLKQWVYHYLKYPERAAKEGIMGRVIVSFIIEKDGSVTNVQALESPDELLSEEAVKVVKASPKWKPARINDNAVRSRVEIPVEFRLKK